ncbi:TIM barrel protein [Arthrobacter sp. StoSoilA2]|uniref:TIM barrel protein n=1 Tax=Arthrobacter sp. StoSoilA2 TaxID=2830990 RepID=UPI001CC604E2|nr:TIM barrel protein [Arthrobacter sp. StoSoilA2]
MSRSQLQAVRAAGIEHVEFWSWVGKDLDAVEAAVNEFDLSVVSMVSQPQGHLVDPVQQETFLQGLRESVKIAARLRIPNLVAVSGPFRRGVSHADHRRALVASLKAAAPVAEAAGVQLILEPWNSKVDHPGTYLDKAQTALDILEEVSSDNVRLLWDVYHSAVMNERFADILVPHHCHRIGHVQVADHPGRNEPGTGNINWAHAFQALAGAGYDGTIGLEYIPRNGSAESMAFVRRLLAEEPWNTNGTDDYQLVNPS